MFMISKETEHLKFLKAFKSVTFFFIFHKILLISKNK